MTNEVEEHYDGVGTIWRKDGRWYFRTIYGKHGGPTDKSSAKSRMECLWVKDNRKRAGVYEYPGHRISEKQRSVWAAQENLIIRAWK